MKRINDVARQETRRMEEEAFFVDGSDAAGM